MERIETTHNNLYIKGVKSGSASVTLACDDPITVDVISYNDNLKGDVDITITGNNTNAVVVNISYEDLYLNGETYSGSINASTASDVLSIPVIINCSDTLIYTNIPNNVITDIKDTRIEYSSLPEVNKVKLVGGANLDISNRLAGYYPSPKTLDISADEISKYDYIIASNGLSQIAIKNDVYISDNPVDPDDPDNPVESVGYAKLYFNINQTNFDQNVNSNGEMFVGVYDMVAKAIALDAIVNVRNIKYPDDTRWGSEKNLFGFYIEEPGSYFVEFEYDLLRMQAFGDSGVSAIHSLGGRITDSLYSMFGGCESLVDISPLRKWDTRDVTSMSYMFSNCTSLANVSALTNWDTSNVTNMSEMFGYCYSLANISPLADWDTSKVTEMDYMFSHCYSLADISPLANWDTSKVTDMDYMFTNCTSLADISSLTNWDTSNVTSMYCMFYDCRSLKSVPLLDTSKVTDMGYMFTNCRSLENLGGFTGMKASLDLRYSHLLTHESLMNVINNLATVSVTKTLRLHSDSIAKLSDAEIAIATNKGWVIR